MTQDWKETLQSEIIEHYVFLAEIKQHAKDRTAHMVEMREQWEKLCSFIESLLKEERNAVLEEVKRGIGSKIQQIQKLLHNFAIDIQEGMSDDQIGEQAEHLAKKIEELVRKETIVTGITL